MSKMVRRLFRDFQPDHYDLTVDPNKDTMKFSGSVRIRGKKVSRPSKRLTFHQNGIKITDATIVYHDKKGEVTIEVVRINHHNNFDEVRLHTERSLYPGKYTVKLSFRGAITEPMKGLYPCFFKYKEKDEIILATQFESHHAREVFPCIDEPEAKATFTLTLFSPKGEAVISNTPIMHQKVIDQRAQTQFETSPRMSTYLLAFVIGKLSFKEAQTKDGVVVRTYATPDNIKYSQFTLDNAVKILEYFNDYFGIPYPLPKCDLVALPDFAAGAMENWGCITFREQAFLVDPRNTSLGIKQHVAIVIAHELAHQWFGNLVTMKWWNDLWLNEGFASWIEYLAVDYLFPKWDMWTQFAIDDFAPALALDALENSHPIEVPINHPDDIRSAFDTISYSKGSSIIQMLHNYIGPEAFQKGLHHYLTEHAYSNTETKDLWLALETATHKPVADFMHAWVTQTGFPFVRADISESSMLLAQERFLINPISRKKVKEQTIWPIPLLADGIEEEVFDKPEISFPILSKKIIKLNKGQSGFYRVGYNETQLAALAKVVLAGKMPPLDRFGLLSDTFEAAKAGFIDTVSALNLLSNYRHEDNAVIWELIAANVTGIRATMNDEELRQSMKPFIRKIIDEQLQRLGWDEKDHESHLDKLLRPIILGLAAGADDPKVLDKIHKQFRDMRSGEDIHPDLRGVIYTTVARLGGAKEFNKLFKLYKETENSEERVTLAISLTNFKQPALILRALDLIDSDLVKLQDVFYWVAYSFSNRFAKTATWEWMVSHWDWLEKNLGTDITYYRIPVYAAMPFSDSNFLPTYKKFFKKVSTPSLERAVNQGVEIIQWESAWRTRDLRNIKSYFKNA